MPKQAVQTRKISIDLPLDLWARFEELGRMSGMKIRDFVLGSFDAIDFFDKFLQEVVTEVQLRDVSPLLMRQLEKFERLYLGKLRSKNLQKPVIFFDKHNEYRKNMDLGIQVNDIVSQFDQFDQLSSNIMEDKKKKLVLMPELE